MSHTGHEDSASPPPDRSVPVDPNPDESPPNAHGRNNNPHPGGADGTGGPRTRDASARDRSAGDRSAGDRSAGDRSARDRTARARTARSRRAERSAAARAERAELQRADDDPAAAADGGHLEPAVPPPAPASSPDPEATASFSPAASVSTGPAAAAESARVESADPASPGTAPGRRSEAAQPGGTFRSLKIRNFRLYFTGNVLCQTGTWMNRVAQDWLVLQLTDDDPVALGIATALQFGPTLALSMWAGTLADRADKRKLLRWIQLVLGLAGISLGVLAWVGVAQIWHVYLACLVVGVAASVDGPVRQSFVAELVGPANLPNAVALNALGFNGARIVGPAVAGVLISLVDTGPVMAVSGLSYIAVIVGLTMIDPSTLRRSKPVQRKKGQTREGLRYIRNRPDLILVMTLLFMVATFGMNFQVTLAIMAKIVFDKDAASYGLLSTAIAVGALLGALVSARRTTAPRQRLLIGTAFGFGVVETILGFVGWYELLAVLLIPQGMLMLAFTNAANAMVQMSTTPAMRGRVMGVYTLAFLGGTPFFAPVLGVLAERWGGGAPLVFGGVISAVSAVVIGVWLVRTSGVTFQVRVTPVPHLHLANPVAPDDDEHLSETIADSLQRIGGGARRTVRPAVRVARRTARAGRRVGRRVTQPRNRRR